MTLFLLPLAYAAEPAPETPTPGALTVDVYVDTSLSTKGRPEEDVALVEAVRSVLRDDDWLRVKGFDGTLHPILDATAPGQADVTAAFENVAYTGLATFFAPVWFDVSARRTENERRTHVVIIATDGTSDPLNRAAKERPPVDDPSWKDSPPAVLAGTPVIWVIRDDRSKSKKGQQEVPTLGFTGGAIPARWTEPSSIESTLLFWNPPSAWTAPTTTDLPSWVTSLRPPPPPPLPAEEPTTDWGAFARAGALALGGLVACGGLVAGGLVARRKAGEKALELARGLDARTADQALRKSTTRRAALRLEPLGVVGETVRREVRPGDTLDVGPTATWPGIPLALPGGGFSIQIGPRPDRATVQPRGTRAGVALLRKGYVVALGPGAPVEVGDGDVVIDARNETPLVRIHLGEEAPLPQ